jgi:WD40 repeat protein
VQIWRLDAGDVAEVGSYGERVRAVAWSPDGLRFATGDDNGRLQLWDGHADREPVELGHYIEHGVRTIAWSPDGRLLATGHNDGSVWLWGPRPEDEPVQLGSHRIDVNDLAWSPDGSQVVSVGGESLLMMWRVSTANRDDNELRCTLALDGALSSLAWHPSGDLLAVAGSLGLYVLEVAR